MRSVRKTLDLAKRHNVYLKVDGDKLAFRCPPNAMTPHLRQQLRDYKAEILSVLIDYGDNYDDMTFTVTRSSLSATGPVRYFATSMWDSLATGTIDPDGFNTYEILRINRSLDLTAVKASARFLLERYDALSSCFSFLGNSLVLSTHTDATLIIDSVSLDLIHGQTEENLIATTSTRLISRAFDVARPPLFRVFTIEMSKNYHVVGLIFHHLICDGYSKQILTREFLHSYLLSPEAASQHLSVHPRFSYIDYLFSLDQWLNRALGASHVRYWTMKLRDAAPVRLSNSIRSDSHNASDVGHISFELSSTITALINRATSHFRTTKFVLLLAAQKIALSQITGLQDVTILGVSQMRDNPTTFSIIGQLSDDIAYRTNISEASTLSDAIALVHETVVDAHIHQPVPFSVIREELRTQNVRLDVPFFNFIQVPVISDALTKDATILSIDGPKFTLKKMAPPGAAYGLVIVDVEERLIGNIYYPAEIYTEAEVRTYLDHFQMILMNSLT